ncbi:MAG: hypothetical protein ACRD4R_06730 [Candidatus Acidiferrales bacterium]
MDDSFTLDGRKFQAVGQALTASQDDYILAHLRLAGALEVLSGADGQERDTGAKAEELLTRVLLSGRGPHILAGCLTEDGRKWTRAEADRNAAAFAELTDDQEKLTMRECIVRIVVGFFSFGKESSATSPNSSSRRKTGRHIKSAAAAT